MVTLVIPVFNKSHLTVRCLDSVLQNSRQVQAIVVVDNASSDQTAEVLKAFKSRFEERKISFTTIRNEKNLGFGTACNQGIRGAKTEYVAVLNNDTWVMPAWDQALIDAQKEKSLDVVGPFFDERPWTENMIERAQAFLKKNPHAFRNHFVPILMFFTQSAIERVRFPHGGVFDERFFVTYEDTDLLHRMRELHFKIAQTSLCYIWHESMGTRSSLPSGYEVDGLRIFQEKWGFDPRIQEHRFLEKLKRRYRKSRAAKGMF